MSFRGKFVWYELMTSDVPAAQAFYGSVLGWTAKDSGMPGMTYILFHAGENGVGGLMSVPEDATKMGMKPCWMGYVAVDDVDASAAEVKTMGGVVHREPAEIPGVGRFAVVGDPQGAGIMLFKGTTPPTVPPPAPGTPGTGGWHELHTTDNKAAFDFYSKLFGWTRGEAMDMGPMGTYQIFKQDDQMLGGMVNKQPQMPMPFWLYYFNIKGIDAAAERIKTGGGKVLNGPMEVPGGAWIIQCSDPQGAMFALVGSRG